MKIDGVTAIALVFLASFAIDRIVTAILFLASFVGKGEREGARAERLRKLVYFVLAGILSVAVLVLGNIRILRTMGVPDANPLLDALLTGLILMGGAEQLSGVLHAPSEPATEHEKPIQVTGSLTIEDTSGRLSGTLKASG
ncbi:MAG TPA: hypothetical protein VLM38_12360 [Blastocatellia bacterium]|nr:hypothetical protein [Blastocatellia bacterium]